MLSVKAIYDGQKLKLAKELNISKPQRVIVIFLDYPDNGDEEAPLTAKDLHAFYAENPSFDFLAAEEEDIYADSDLKVKY
jgi:hypothetical protein